MTPDPILHLMPADQLTRVLADETDIDPEFLGFTAVYQGLASIIPKHFTVVDFGCAYAPQAALFCKHKAYIGIDMWDGERFAFKNTKHMVMRIQDAIVTLSAHTVLNPTFAICSYVPDDEARRMVRTAFPNVFVYYPAGGPHIVLRRCKQ